MSMLLMVKAMQTKVGNPLRKLVLIKLADNANDNGECWPSHQYIADQCEISKRSVINHISKLEKMGLLIVENRVINNEKRSNVYHLRLDNSSAANSLGSAKDAPSSAGDALGSGAGDAHRTSHSIEPVNESINEPTYKQSFENFWSAYPRKVNKKGAEKSWLRIKPNAELVTEIMSSLSAHAKSADWTKDNGKFIPHATTWLNNERWNDVVDGIATSNSMSGADYMVGI